MTMVTPRSGFDLEYYLNRTGGEKTGGRLLPERGPAGGAGRAAGSARAPRRWGLRDGQVVRREPYLAVYTQTDPQIGGAAAGPGPGRLRQVRARSWRRKLAAEPHATRRAVPGAGAGGGAGDPPVAGVHRRDDRAQQERVGAARLVPGAGPAGPAGRGHRRGRRCGGPGRSGCRRSCRRPTTPRWSGCKQHAGFTRTGYHGRRVDGVEPGRWARALPVVTTWLQGTNRDGEPHDHSHNVIARMALTEVRRRVARGGHDGAARASWARWRPSWSRASTRRWRASSASALRRARTGAGTRSTGLRKQTLDAYSTRAHAVTRKARGAGAPVGAQVRARAERARDAVHHR